MKRTATIVFFFVVILTIFFFTIWKTKKLQKAYIEEQKQLEEQWKPEIKDYPAEKGKDKG